MRRVLQPVRLGTLAMLVLATVVAIGASSASGVTFLARAPRGGFECGMADVPGPSYDQRVLCISNWSVARSHRLILQEVQLTPEGKVGTCVEHGLVNKAGCNFGNADEGTPTFRPGRVVTEGRFRCRVMRRSVACAVLATGQGFRLSTHKVVLLGGAETGPPPPSPFR